MTEDVGHRISAATNWVTGTIWVLSWFAAVLSFVHLIQYGVGAKWSAPFDLIVSTYEELAKLALDWVRPIVRGVVIDAQFELNWNPIVVPVFGQIWKHVLIALLLYFGVMARTSWQFGDHGRAIFRSILGGAVAISIAIFVGVVWQTFDVGTGGSISNLGIMSPQAETKHENWNSPLWMALHAGHLPKFFAPIFGLAAFHFGDAVFSAVMHRESGQTRVQAFLASQGAIRLIMVLIIAAGIFFIFASVKSRPEPAQYAFFGLAVALYSLVLMIIVHLIDAIFDATRWREPGRGWWSAFLENYNAIVVRRIAEVVIGAALFFAANAAVTPL